MLRTIKPFRFGVFNRAGVQASRGGNLSSTTDTTLSQVGGVGSSARIF